MPDSDPIRISGLPLATSADYRQDTFPFVDSDDTSVAATGRTKRASFQTAHDWAIPTAAQLSVSGALQSYLDDEAAKTHRNGPIQLPPGTITYDTPLDIGQYSGVSIHGTNWHHNLVSGDSANGWDNNDRGTRLHFTGNSGDAAITYRGAAHTHLEGLTLSRANPGVGIRFTSATGGFNCAFNSFYRIMIGDCTECFRTEAGTDTLQSDMDLRFCFFRDSDTGIRITADQNVAFTVTGCHFHRLDDAIYVSEGGHVKAFGNYCNGVSNTFFRWASSGANTNPNVIHGVRMDRTGGAGFPTIVDASEAGVGNIVADVTGASVIRKSGESIPDDHYFFKLNANWQPFQSEIFVGTTNFRAFGGRDRVHQIGVYNDAGVLTGYIQPDRYVSSSSLFTAV